MLFTHLSGTRGPIKFLWDASHWIGPCLKPVQINRLVRVRVIAVAIFALLFAQWSVAAYACPSPSVQPT